MNKEETPLPTNLDQALILSETIREQADEGVAEMENLFRALIDRTRDAEDEAARLKRELAGAYDAGGRLLDMSLALIEEDERLKEVLAKLRGPGPREDTTPAETSESPRASTVLTLTDAPCPAVLDHVACLDCGGHFAEDPAAPFRCCPKCGREWRGEWLTLDLAKDTLTPYRCLLCSAVVFNMTETALEHCPRCGRRNLFAPDSEAEEPENTIVTPLQISDVPFIPFCQTCDDTDGYDWECEECGDRTREAFLERDRTGRPCLCPVCVRPAKPLEPRPLTGDGKETAKIRLVPSSFTQASVLELLCEACGRSFPWIGCNLDDRHPLAVPPADAPVFCPSCGRMIKRKDEK